MRRAAAVLALVFIACDAPPHAGIDEAASASPSPALERYEDAVVGIAFTAPAGLVVTHAQPGVDGRTTQAIFRTAGLQPDRTVDLANELSISAYIASRATNEDLRAFVARGFAGSYAVSSFSGRNDAIVLDGDGQAGPRRYALIARDPGHVLIIDAFPRYSSRIGLFDQVLGTLEVR